MHELVSEFQLIILPSHASMKTNSFSRNLLACKRATVGYETTSAIRRIDITLILPRVKALDFRECAGVLNPLDNLGHCDKVGVRILLKHLIDPKQEGFQEFRIILQPGRMEEEAERGSILEVVPTVEPNQITI